MNNTIDCSKNSFIAEKIEYLCYPLANGIDSFATYKGIFIDLIVKTSIGKSSFEVLELFIKILTNITTVSFILFEILMYHPADYQLRPCYFHIDTSLHKEKKIETLLQLNN